ncbi:hypothetical protein J8273_7027 [Carpediemonas membranifera]|uniref:Uncharacterized protein n=1 Tax=Carpediemonas membranifera TaxID=201153 RepID=A0A8J6DXQ4_9EUKA|nr:hypothetical protein J8273_7027 [Carpediemonas membranifera]|eukprot:KAG9390774.1 hypothetical protein J8273_7027 [Carpediemonas membranifera]
MEYLALEFCESFVDSDSHEEGMYVPPAQAFNLLDCLNEVYDQIFKSDNDNETAKALVHRFYQMFPTRGMMTEYSTIQRYFGDVGDACTVAAFWLFFALFEWVYGSENSCKRIIQRALEVKAEPDWLIDAIADEMDVAIPRTRLPVTPMVRMAPGAITSPAILGRLRFDMADEVIPVSRKILMGPNDAPPRTPRRPAAPATPGTPVNDESGETVTPETLRRAWTPVSQAMSARRNGTAVNTPSGSFQSYATRRSTRRELAELNSPVVTTPVRRSSRLSKGSSFQEASATGLAYSPNPFLK